MSAKPLVSVVIPTYNYGRFVTEAVDSALAQSYSPVEVIVVDDGSTDDTRERLNIYGDRIRYLYQQNQGLSAARNTGMSVARGEYIALLDSDDEYHPRKLEHQVDYILKHPEIGLIGTRGLSDPARRWPEVDSLPPCHRIALDAAVVQVPFCPSSVMLSRTCYRVVGEFDPTVSAAADRDYWIRAVSQLVVARLEAPLTYYRVHPNSMSRNVETMIAHELAVLSKALSMPEVSCSRSLRRRAWAQFRYSAALMYREAGQNRRAIANLFRSMAAWPFRLSISNDVAGARRLWTLMVTLRNLVTPRSLKKEKI